MKAPPDSDPPPHNSFNTSSLSNLSSNYEENSNEYTSVKNKHLIS